MKHVVCNVFVLVLGLLGSVAPISAQDWVPNRLVGLEYPPLAIQARVSGTVRIKCILGENGRVVSAEILDVSEPAVRELLGSAAQKNALEWSFSATSAMSRQQVAPVISYSFSFQVSPDPKFSRSRSRFIFEFPQSVQVIAEIPAPQISR